MSNTESKTIEFILQNEKKIIIKASVTVRMVQLMISLQSEQRPNYEIFSVCLLNGGLVLNVDQINASDLSVVDLESIAQLLLIDSDCYVESTESHVDQFIRCYRAKVEKLSSDINELVGNSLNDSFLNFASSYDLLSGQINRIQESMKPLAETIKTINLNMQPLISVLSEYQFPMQSIMKSAIEMQKIITPTLVNMKSYMEPISLFLINYNEMTKPLTQHLNQISMNWANAIKELLEDNKEYLSEKERAVLISADYDWYITYDFLVDRQLIREINMLNIDDDNKAKLDHLFKEYYSNDKIIALIDEISQNFLSEDFSEILNQIKLGYIHKLYYLIIPTILLLIEAVIAKNKNPNGRMGGEKIKKYLGEILKMEEVSVLRDAINKRMYIQFEHGQSNDSPISRNAIIHGGDINYGNELNAIRFVLILYNIAFSLDLTVYYENNEILSIN